MSQSGWAALCMGCWLAGATLAAPATAPEDQPVTLPAPATLDSVRFRSYGIRNGLSQSTARALLQDQRGFIWIGTQDGLNRFDGYEFRTFYRIDADPRSIADNHITALELAPDGRIWVGTMAGGVNRFDSASETAERFPTGGDSGLRGLQVVDLAIDGGSRLWVASAGSGLQYLDAGAARFEQAPAALEVPAGTQLRALLPLDDGRLLVGAHNGLYQIDAARTRLHPVRFDSLPPLNVWTLAQAPDGTIYVGLADNGLLALDRALGLAQHYTARGGAARSLPDDQVRSLLATRAGELWVGTMNGVAVLRPASKDFLAWRFDGADQATIAGNRIVSMIEGRAGLLWFGSWTGGISVHNPATRVLRNARHLSAEGSTLPQNPVRAIWRDSDGSFWLGVLEGGGLVHFDRDRGVLRRHVHDAARADSLPNDNVSSVLRRSDGSLWVGTAGGAARMTGDYTFERFVHRPDDPRSIGGTGIIDLHEDPAGRLWIATDDGGVSMQCAGCSGFQRWRFNADDPDTIGSNNIYTISDGPGGRLWIGTSGGGLGLLDPASGKVRRLRARPGEAGWLNHDSITAIRPAQSGGWWLGTQGGGVNRMTGDPLDPASPLQFEAITKSDGLGADAIGGVIEDLDGHLWISTTVGISEYDPTTGKVHNLSANEGLDRAGYFINAYWREPDGTLVFGGLQGLVWFQPEQMRNREPPRSVVISDFRLFNAPVPLQSHEPQSPLSRGITDLAELVLRHDQNVWTLVFSSLNYTAPETARYSYRLAGFQDDWTSSRGNARVATFTGVPEGRYTLHVRASNDDGASWGPETRLRVQVLPAPWRSWPAYLAYCLAIGLAGTWMARRIRVNLRERQQAQAAIRDSQERLKLALWGSRDELWDLDLKSGQLMRENPNPRIAVGAQARFNTREEYLAWVHPDDHEQVLNALSDHLEGRTEFYEVQYRVRASGGGWIWLLGRGQAVNRNERGQATRMVGTNRDITALKEAEEELRSLAEELEARVERRTDALRRANAELQSALEELKTTQERLVETEKMASLGTLVAGVAHEINTPVGIGVTAASHLEHEARKLGQAIAAGTLSKSELNRFRDTAQESSELILRNLERASHLIKSFKQVAVDQSSEQRRQIFVRQYLDEILFALRPRLKRTQHVVAVDASEQLTADTYPGALYQIVVNLITNSLAHGFEEGASGHILIRAERHESEIGLLYVDDGCGMDEATVKRIFEPFFTTKRGRGGSGLGMHIVYNLVTRMLGGSIKVKSAPGQGVAVEIRFPAAP